MQGEPRYDDFYRFPLLPPERKYSVGWDHSLDSTTSTTSLSTTKEKDTDHARGDSLIDRRSGADRRKAYDLDYFPEGGPEKRSRNERRSRDERRDAWIRVDEWYSVAVRAITRRSRQIKF